MIRRTFALLLASAAVSTATTARCADGPPLAWTNDRIAYDAKPGEMQAIVRFHVRNSSPAPAAVYDVTPSCGCTVAKLPAKPWWLAPGAEGDLVATINLRGKIGSLVKTLSVRMGNGSRLLTIALHIPAPNDPGLEMSRRIAAQDRQAVFSGACAECHRRPLLREQGEALCRDACEICHQRSQRAEMVPDLANWKTAGAPFWRSTISNGKSGTLMPAFALTSGGPLTPEQIEGLVTYLLSRG